jgi:hypothetical protein
VSSTLLSRAEVAALNLLGECNHLLAGEVGPILDVGSPVERKELIGKLKGDIVESLITDRILKAKAE